MPDPKLVNAGSRVSAAVENAQTEELRRLKAAVDRVESQSGGLVRLGYIVSRTRSVASPAAQVGYVVGFWGRPDRENVTVPPEKVLGRLLELSSPAPLVPFEVGRHVMLRVLPPMDGQQEVVAIAEGEEYVSELCGGNAARPAGGEPDCGCGGGGSGAGGSAYGAGGSSGGGGGGGGVAVLDLEGGDESTSVYVFAVEGGDESTVYHPLFDFDDGGP